MAAPPGCFPLSFAQFRAHCALAGLFFAGCAQHRPLPKTDTPVAEESQSAQRDVAAVSDVFGWLEVPGGDSGEVIPEPDDEARALFDAPAVRTFEVELSPDDLAQIDAAPSAEQTVPARLRFDGRAYGDIGIRYKGSAGAFITPCTAATTPGSGRGAKVGKCSIKLDFAYRDDEARFYGLKKLNLHSMGRDPSFMREQLGYGLFRARGIAAPRSSYARLVINGKLEGLFLMVEQLDARFTRSRFSEGGNGNLYKEVWPLYPFPMPYRKALETNEGPTTDVDKIMTLAWTLRVAPERALDWLDLTYSLRYLAVDRAILNDDGALHWYCYVPQGANMGLFNNHNYYWYEAESAGRLWLVPWDLDARSPASRACASTPTGCRPRTVAATCSRACRSGAPRATHSRASSRSTGSSTRRSSPRCSRGPCPRRPWNRSSRRGASASSRS